MSEDIHISPTGTDEQEVLVRVEGVSKKFCRSLKKSLWYGLADMAGELNPFAKGKEGRPNGSREDELRPGEFWAVSGVSFELRRGECLGLIGRNGAGKTTLLKMLNGLIKPDTGAITMRGRIGALIALGTGFNPILTGRENIYVNGSILGLAKEEIDRKIDDIIEFAEIRDFIDAPVQTYSSGMQVRLGFAVATAMDPDVLILDEVLAVGDAAFRNKCYKRIVSLRKKAAVIFVSHGMEQVSRICDLVLMLTKGRVHYFGDVPGGVRAYESANDEGGDREDAFLSTSEPITDFRVDSMLKCVSSGKDLTLELQINASAPIAAYTIRVIFYNASGGFAADGNLDVRGPECALESGINSMRCAIPVVPLKQGKYALAINLIDPHGDLIVWSYKQHKILVTDSHASAMSDCQLSITLARI